MSKLHVCTSSAFKVKNARYFRRDLSNLIPEEVLTPTEDGFVLWYENTFDEDESVLNKKLIELLQDHLRPGTSLNLVSTITARDSKERNIEFYIITPVAFKKTTWEEVSNTIERTLYPKYVYSSKVVNNYKTKLWIEKNKKYLALKEERTRSRVYLVIEHQDGRKVRWPKEYFYEERL